MEVFLIIAIFIIKGIVLSHVIVHFSRKYYGGGRVSESREYRCGRVHLGPVDDVKNGMLRWEACKTCGCKLSPPESIAYWKTRREAIRCRESALLGAKTK